jgi:hypothetical protein
MKFLVPALLFTFAAAGELPEIEAKILTTVPGPWVSNYHDPSRGFGNDRIESRIRAGARRTLSIPALALPQGSARVLDKVQDIAGWKAYRIDVPPGGTVKARLHGVHEGWFVVRTVNKWGSIEEGMLRNLIPTGNPEASYTNPKTETNTIFFVVDTTEQSIQGEAYRLDVTRN